MSDEQIVDALAWQLALRLRHTVASIHPPRAAPNTRLIASEALTALRDAGFEVYRPEECVDVWWCEDCMLAAQYRSDLACPHADQLPEARLVPISGETPKEEK